MSASLRISRSAGRIYLNAAAQLKTEDGRIEAAAVRDVSQSGAFITTEVRSPLYSVVSLRSAFGDGEWLQACVVRKEPAGMAVEWLDTGPHAMCTFLAVDRLTSVL
jgi:hypothetical protein